MRLDAKANSRQMYFSHEIKILEENRADAFPFFQRRNFILDYTFIR